MKKLLAVVAIVALAFVSCKKDGDDNGGSGSTGGTGGTLTVEKKNRGILLDFSETWCPPCGAYGGPSFDSCMTQEGSVITLMKVYGSSTPASLNASISNGFASAYSVSGVPDFYLNNTELNSGGGVYSNIGSNYNWVMTKANAFAADSVNAGVALKKEVVGDSMRITTKVKFFKAQAAGQDYKIATYIVEDDIIAAQQVTGQGSVANYKHRNLVRACNSSTYAGLPLNSSAAITADQEFNNTYTLYLNPAWNKAKLKVIAVIWKGGVTPNKVINSNVAK
ncbi:MAG: Omp28-related outer membrane protein [Bacteroidia bacterium]|nr:Omp28-related outer membrane protein [Bacteroidia bacterium]